ncbi:hypothetical protein Trydic_g1312 [Trypoxylus dichotomus]
MKIPPRIMSYIIKQDLALGAYQRTRGQRLTTALRNVRETRSKALVQRYANGEAAEKIGEVERGHHPAIVVVVWCGVVCNGVNQLRFCEQLNDSLLAGKHWAFRQDFAPAHKRIHRC